MITKIPLTRKGYDELNSELRRLKAETRPAVIEEIAEARSHGDLSENAEYHAAREKQSFVEGRIQQLEDALGRSEIVDPQQLSGNSVKFGATVELEDDESGEVALYQIVGDLEADIESKKISISSPLSKALIGKQVEDSVEVSIPKGVKLYTILAVSYQP